MSEMTLSVEEWSALQEQLISLKQEKYDAKDNLEKAQRELKTAEGKMAALEKSLLQQEKKITKLDKEKTKAQAKLKESKDRKALQQIKEEKEALQRQILDLQEEQRVQREALQEANRNMFEENKQLKDQIDELKMRPSSANAADPDAPTPIDSKLQREYEKLKVQNASLLESLEKKNDEVQHLKGDTERVMEKLGQALETENVLREQIASRDADKKTLEEKLSESAQMVSSLQDKVEEVKRSTGPNEADSKKLDALQSQIQSLTEKLNESESRCSRLQKQVDAADSHLQDKQVQIDQLSEAAKLQAYEVSEYQAKVMKREQALQQLQEEHEKANADAAKERADLVEDFEGKLQEAERALREETAKYDSVNEALIQLSEERDALQSEVEQLKSQLQETKSNAEQAQLQFDKLQNSIADGDVERKIETKKRNQLVKELKSQLKTLTQRNSILTAELKATKIQAEEYQAQVQRLQAAAAHDDGKSKQGSKLSRSISDGNFESLSRKKPSSRPSTIVEQEVSAALSHKLAEVQDRNFTLKNKCDYLEQSIQELTKDLEDKKAVIQNYMFRFGTGAFTNGQMQKAAQRKAKVSDAMQRELMEKMELILQETTIENGVLRDAKDKLGKEVQRLAQELESAKRAT